MLTGLSNSLARFQARSAFFQVGFTTSESEAVVNHPVRREIILMMILAGNPGFVTVLSTVVLSFTEAPEVGIGSQPGFRVSAIAIGLVLVWIVSYSKWLERRLNQVVGWVLRRFTQLEARGIERRDGAYLGAPRGTVELRRGDKLVANGTQETVGDFETRGTGECGDLARAQAVERRRLVESG